MAKKTCLEANWTSMNRIRKELHRIPHRFRGCTRNRAWTEIHVRRWRSASRHAPSNRCSDSRHGGWSLRSRAPKPHWVQIHVNKFLLLIVSPRIPRPPRLHLVNYLTNRADRLHNYWITGHKQHINVLLQMVRRKVYWFIHERKIYLSTFWKFDDFFPGEKLCLFWLLRIFMALSIQFTKLVMQGASQIGEGYQER